MEVLFGFAVILITIIVMFILFLKIMSYNEAHENVYGDSLPDKIYTHFYGKARMKMLNKKLGYKISCDNCNYFNKEDYYSTRHCEYCYKKYFSDWSKKEED